MTERRQDRTRIRELRQQRGLKPHELASLAGCKPAMVYAIEAHRRFASPELLHRIAKALEVEFEELLHQPEQVA